MNQQVSAPTAADLVAAREIIARYLRPTPTYPIDLRGRSVYAKLELFQIYGAFKVRGALAAVAAAHREDPSGAVITSSAGNHGLGIAFAATTLGVPATVVVPANASPLKVKKLRGFDIELIEWGSSYDDAQTKALELAAARGIHYISPFNDTHVVAGQSTLFDEFFAAAPDMTHVIVPVGGGGLISGAIVSREAAGRSDLRITGVQPEHSAAMYHVLRGVAMNEVRHRPTIADGLAGGGDEDAVTNELIATNNVDLVLVPEALIREGVREAADHNGLIMEGSAATAYAAITNQLITDVPGPLGFVACGRNIAPELVRELLLESLH
jgi:threonine dehydratase